MIYHVIGLMSGSSLDGLDIAFVRLEEVRGKWSFTIDAAECVPYDGLLTKQLAEAPALSGLELAVLHTAYGRYLGQQVRAFMEKYQLDHKVHFVVSHGHTIHHEPVRKTTVQIGDGAALAITVGLPAITDLRASDVALGGQGAPIVPIGDNLLFGDYDYLLNIGGIANLSARNSGGSMLAFDVCPANQMFNELARLEGQPMDRDGLSAASGVTRPELLEELERAVFYKVSGPRSLSNVQCRALYGPLLSATEVTVPDRLRTAVALVAGRVRAAVETHSHGKEVARMLVTGGGALNSFLVGQLSEALSPLNVLVEVPDEHIVNFKEAVVMALIGTLRWREEPNVLSSVTGAARDSVSGAIWLP